MRPQDEHDTDLLLNQRIFLVPMASGSTILTPPRPSECQLRVDANCQALPISSSESVTQFNNKLVKSYDSVSDLEDDLHISSQNLRTFSLKVSQLELKRTQHLSALNTGLLLLNAQVMAELMWLMEKATDEVARRGQAESVRAEIEEDLDDLSAGLFNQANTMVAEARFTHAQSKRKVEDAEHALKEAEEVVGLMQQRMQGLQDEKEESERRLDEMAITMGKSKWVERVPLLASSRAILLA
ncbi:hypothetical protein EW146_g9168 [Bondarzewia mesenterica]|uniref:GDP/GTP exchange factor Sec2 N-terminal domain-containing protein n=1 Tax=Bondarzewia mesenterica TaxID=1095465 RepID=A0A4S4L8R6_9AGAM|nr:hypothetical protein EW146_g9168 [Bondarzewia mesenterica]